MHTLLAAAHVDLVMPTNGDIVFNNDGTLAVDAQPRCNRLLASHCDGEDIGRRARRSKQRIARLDDETARVPRVRRRQPIPLNCRVLRDQDRCDRAVAVARWCASRRRPGQGGFRECSSKCMSACAARTALRQRAVAAAARGGAARWHCGGCDRVACRELIEVRRLLHGARCEPAEAFEQPLLHIRRRCRPLLLSARALPLAPRALRPLLLAHERKRRVLLRHVLRCLAGDSVAAHRAGVQRRGLRGARLVATLIRMIPNHPPLEQPAELHRVQ